MIISFKHKGLKIYFETGYYSKINPDHKNRLRLILSILNAAKDIQDVNFPGSGLHMLRGEYKGYWSVTVNGNWRVIFKFYDSKAAEVDYIDYH